MRRLIWIASAVTALAQPRLLINASVDVVNVQDLRATIDRLVAVQLQPAWIGYSVPALRAARLGCDYVRDGFAQPGVIHLEPSNEAIILFRVENGKINRMRTLSGYCEIDAQNLPVHWLNGVRPDDSVAVLRDMIDQHPEGLTALAAHESGAPALIDMVKAEKDQAKRRKLMSALERGHDPRAVAFFETLLR